MTDELPEYVQNAKFIKPGLDVDEELWPRKPERYNPSTKFIQRFRDFGSIISGDDIEDAIKYGELFTASEGCVTFVNDAGGVAFYIIVTRELMEDRKREAKKNNILNDLDEHRFHDYSAVTIWPYVYDTEKALDTGKWSSKDLEKIKQLAIDNPEEKIDEFVNDIEVEK